MSGSTPRDPAHGYETASEEFITRRTRSAIGVATVGRWAELLPAGGDVLDLGCGSGVPITRALVDRGFVVHGVDSSPSMVAAFRARFPHVPVECASVGSSTLLDRTFDGIVAWGLMFLLPPADQAHLIGRMAAALRPGGRLLFTAPAQRCTWDDILTGRESVSLGSAVYRRLLAAEHLEELDETEDEGENHYYSARKPTGGPDPDAGFGRPA